MSIIYIDNPCYNKLTKVDCPNREPYCGATCKKWKAYEKMRNEEYKKELIRKEVERVNYAPLSDRLKYEIQNRQNPRKMK